MNDFISKFIDYNVTKFNQELHLEKFVKSLQYSYDWAQNNMICFLIESDGEHALIMMEDEKNNWAYFGYLKFNSEKSIKLWSKIETFCKSKQINSLLGPIQGSTYFPYRCINKTDGRGFFQGEYFSDQTDAKILNNLKPSKIINYRSAIREKYNNVMEISKPYYDQLCQKGLRVELVNELDESSLKSIYEIVQTVFSKNWGYQEIGYAHFKKLFSNGESNISRMSMHKIMYQDKLIGFSRYTEESSDTIIFRTIGILPEYQKMGIGNAVVYQMHADALDFGYSKAIYALVRTSNRVKNMPQPDVFEFRTYQAFEFNF